MNRADWRIRVDSHVETHLWICVTLEDRTPQWLHCPISKDLSNTAFSSWATQAPLGASFVAWNLSHDSLHTRDDTFEYRLSAQRTAAIGRNQAPQAFVKESCISTRGLDASTMFSKVSNRLQAEYPALFKTCSHWAVSKVFFLISFT